MAFFDFTSEIIAHQVKYDSIFTIKTYLKSIIDNLLTPGFDLFDQPKIANSLNFIYLGIGNPSKLLLETNYQSDQLGIYGEFFNLFGYFSFILFSSFSPERQNLSRSFS